MDSVHKKNSYLKDRKELVFLHSSFEMSRWIWHLSLDTASTGCRVFKGPVPPTLLMNGYEIDWTNDTIDGGQLSRKYRVVS